MQHGKNRSLGYIERNDSTYSKWSKIIRVELGWVNSSFIAIRKGEVSKSKRDEKI